MSLKLIFMPVIKILILISKVRLGNPKKNKILLFDNTCSNIMHEMILKDMAYTILPARWELYYISPQIIFYMLKNLAVGRLKKKGFRGNYLLYLLSCVEHVKPKIVITFIDNSFLFQSLSRLYDKADFYAIQNGVRTANSVSAWLPSTNKIISMTNFICFGQHEVELYKKYGHQIDNYFPVGSLIGSYYKFQVSKNTVKNEYALCLVSQWRRSFMLDADYPEMRKGFNILNEYLSKYVKEKDVTLAIATCSSDQAESDYFVDIYGTAAKIFKFDRMNLSTYAAMDKSEVVITIDSSAALEAFGWGKKALFCNFTGDEGRNLLKPGPWVINELSYDRFKAQLDYLLQLDNNEYLSVARDCSRYMMNYDVSRPAHVFLRELIQNNI